MFGFPVTTCNIAELRPVKEGDRRYLMVESLAPNERKLEILVFFLISVWRLKKMVTRKVHECVCVFVCALSLC